MSGAEKIYAVFDGVRASIRTWLDTHNIEDVAEIDDARYRRLFDIIIEETDKEPAWTHDASQRRFMKKAALIACSKIGNDGAYNHVVARIMRRVAEEKLFSDAEMRG